MCVIFLRTRESVTRLFCSALAAKGTRSGRVDVILGPSKIVCELAAGEQQSAAIDRHREDERATAMLDKPHKLQTYQTYIDGKWVDAASGKSFETMDPYTGEPWALIPECDKSDVDRAVEAAYRAFETGPWPQMTPSARGKAMRRIAGLIEKHAEHLGRIEVRDNGKLISEMAAQTR